jgi:predicted membrane-bound spermidine synthase
MTIFELVPMEANLGIAAGLAATLHYMSANNRDSFGRVVLSVLSFLFTGVVGFLAALLCTR